MSFKMPALETLPKFSGENFPQWFRGLKLRLRVGNDLGGVAIPPPADVMVQIIEAKTSGAAAAFWSSSAPLQAILVKDGIMEEDLNTMVKLFSDRFPSSMAPEEKKNTREQKKIEEHKNPAEKLKNLSQGKDMSAEEYYQQAVAVLHAFNIEDKNYETLNDYEPHSLHAFFDPRVSFDPSKFIQTCVIGSYIRGLYDEELRAELLTAGAIDSNTLADVYTAVKTCSNIIALRKTLREEETARGTAAGCNPQ